MLVQRAGLTVHQEPILLQIPLVDGELWWQYAARLENWPMDVGNSETVAAVQSELMKVFQPAKPKAKHAGQAPKASQG